MSIIFLNRFFYPDHSATSQILSDLAFHLSGTGHQVKVITGRQRYDDPSANLSPYERERGVEIHRVRTPRFGRSRLLGRTLDYAGFYIAASTQLWKIARPDDIIVAKTDPPLISILVD